jgi:hypothetical protein
MSPPLISRSADLQRLRDEGFEFTIKGGHLLVATPYVNARREVQRGFLVTDLTLAGNVTTVPSSHVAYFVGEHPCHRDGREIEQIRHQANRADLGQGVVVDRSFSNKPKGGYADYYEKITTYTAIISGPAESLDPSVTARTYRALPSEGEDSVFHYLDTASTRAGIAAITEKLVGLKVAIVGVGGTGSYVLDLVAKCPVGEIHLFDGDRFLQHNAFRSPGAPSVKELEFRPYKVERFATIYRNMHRGVVPHPYDLDEARCSELAGVDFVFVCVDKGSVKRPIVEFMEANGIAFVDVGMGVEVIDDKLLGILRVTTSTPDKRDHLRQRVGFGDTDGGDYARNIQIADLNALNAALAVVRWKKWAGVYSDQIEEHNSTYTIDSNMLCGDDTP